MMFSEMRGSKLKFHRASVRVFTQAHVSDTSNACAQTTKTNMGMVKCTDTATT
jgi:hypothetical protein